MGSCAFKPTCNESNETNKEKESLINQPFRIITPDDVAEMKQEVSRKKIAKAPLFLNESMFAYQALESFKAHRLHYGLVIDEYGVTVGMVTMDDVVDALVGESTEMDQTDYQIVEREDGTWLIDGQYSLIDFEKYFDFEISYQNKSFTTLAGLILHQSGYIPNVGDTVVVENLRLEVVDKDGQRIDKVLVSRV